MPNNPAPPTSAQHFEQMLGMITGYWVSQIVRTVADLHIAEHLADGPLTSEQISEREDEGASAGVIGGGAGGAT